MTAPSPVPREPWLKARWWHKWIGIVIGVLLVIWIGSGIFMLIPPSAANKGVTATPKPIDWQSVSVSPARAADVARAAVAGANVRQITIIRLRDEPVYVVAFEGGASSIVRATDGALITITPEVALDIARRSTPGVSVASTERVTRKPRGYYGRVPAYRIAFADDAQTVAVVSEATGELSRSQRRDRVLGALGHNLHVFSSLGSWPGGELTRRGTLAITSLTVLVSVLTGYWLALPRRWRRRTSA